MISLAFTPPVTKPASYTLEKLTRKKKILKKLYLEANQDILILLICAPILVRIQREILQK